MAKTKREKALESDIYEASEFIADLALWLTIRSSKKKKEAFTKEDWLFIERRLDEALATLDYYPHPDSGYTYQG